MINDRVADKQSFFKQHAELLLFIMGMFVIIVGGAIYFTQAGQGAHGTAVSSIAAAVNNTTHLLPTTG